MRKQINAKITKKLDEINKGVNLSMPDADEPTTGRKVNFVKFDESGDAVHGFKDKIVIQKENSIFAINKKDKNVVLPLDIITFISLEFDVNAIKNALTKKYDVIQDLIFEDNKLYARVDIIKATELGLPVLNLSKRSLDEYLSEENIPKEIRHIAAPKTDPVRLKDGLSYVLLNNDAVITSTILKNLVYVDSIDATGSKSEQREQRKEFLREATGKFIKSVKITDSKILKKKIYFALVVDSDDTKLAIEVSTANIVAANFSMHQDRFSELAEEKLGTIRKGTKVDFVRTSEVINSKTRDLVFSRSDNLMMRNPMVRLVELTEKDIEAMLTKDPNAVPQFIYKEENIPDHYAMYGIQQTKEVDPAVVRALFADFYTGEAVIFQDPAKGFDYLCPDIKKLSMFALTGDTKLPIKVGVVSTTDDIAIGFETEK